MSKIAYFIIFLMRVYCAICNSIVMNVSSNTFISLKRYSSLNNPNQCFFEAGSSVVDSGFCFPSLIVAGFPKCGTSYLFRTLATNPSVVPTKRKELCLGGPLTEDWGKMILKLPSIKETGNSLVLSGCLHFGSNVRAVSELQVDGTKLIYVVRDVADMLWAAYNYWCIFGVDSQCVPGARTDLSSQRSPKQFHSMVERALPMGGGVPLNIDGSCYRAELELAVLRFGKENVMVVKSEDFLDNDRKLGQLHRVASFVGVYEQSTNWIRVESMKMQKVNAGYHIRNRGEHAISNMTGLMNGLYEVSGFVPMLETTRKLLYSRWLKECIWLRIKFAIVYDACREHS